MPNEAFVIENQIRDAKGSRGALTIPCGLIGENGEIYTDAEIREISGHEEDMLASKKIPASRKMGTLLAKCCTRLGPYTGDELEKQVRNLPVGDRVLLLLRIRQITLGDEFPYRHECPECNYKGMFTIDLNDMEVKAMPDPTQRIHEFDLSSGAHVRFHIMTGTDEERLSDVMKESDKVTMTILARLDLLDGGLPTLEVIKDLGMKLRNELRDRFNEVEGGVDTSVEIECPRCEELVITELDITQQGFFFPSAALKKWKKKSSSLQSTGT